MSYQVTRDATGKPVVSFADEPTFCHALTATDAVLTPDTGTGWWLVLAFAVWSVPDVVAIGRALELARSFDGALNLGVLPYDDAEELESIWPGLRIGTSSPIWLLQRDGAVVWQHAGTSAEGVVEARVRQALTA